MTDNGEEWVEIEPTDEVYKTGLGLMVKGGKAEGSNHFVAGLRVKRVRGTLMKRTNPRMRMRPEYFLELIAHSDVP